MFSFLQKKTSPIETPATGLMPDMGKISRTDLHIAQCISNSVLFSGEKQSYLVDFDPQVEFQWNSTVPDRRVGFWSQCEAGAILTKNSATFFFSNVETSTQKLNELKQVIFLATAFKVEWLKQDAICPTWQALCLDDHGHEHLIRVEQGKGDPFFVSEATPGVEIRVSSNFHAD